MTDTDPCEPEDSTISDLERALRHHETCQQVAESLVKNLMDQGLIYKDSSRQVMTDDWECIKGELLQNYGAAVWERERGKES